MRLCYKEKCPTHTHTHTHEIAVTKVLYLVVHLWTVVDIVCFITKELENDEFVLAQANKAHICTNSLLLVLFVSKKGA